MTNTLDLWPGLTLRQLLAFRALSETESFAKTAIRLGYSQPAISHQLMTLEEAVGARLLERSSGRGGVTLTEAGQLFLAHCDAVFARFALARADLEALDSGEQGVVRVGSFQSVSARILPQLLARLDEEEGNRITVEFIESTDEAKLLEGLETGAFDFAFALMPVDQTRFEALELLEDGYFLAGGSGGRYELAIDSLDELKAVPLIAPRSCRSWERIADQLRASGVEPSYAFRTDDNLAVRALLESEAGVSFLTRLTLELMGGDLSAAEVGHLVPARRIALVWSRERMLRPHQKTFVEASRLIFAELAVGTTP